MPWGSDIFFGHHNRTRLITLGRMIMHNVTVEVGRDDKTALRVRSRR